MHPVLSRQPRGEKDEIREEKGNQSNSERKISKTRFDQTQEIEGHHSDTNRCRDLKGFGKPSTSGNSHPYGCNRWKKKN
jgi:hypothetical protein